MQTCINRIKQNNERIMRKLQFRSYFNVSYFCVRIKVQLKRVSKVSKLCPVYKSV